nr:putative reverse transcriptase domain-containing protein [Tanacetum cinerariifolium]
MIAGIKVEEEIIRDLERLDIELYVHGQHGYWASLRVRERVIKGLEMIEVTNEKVVIAKEKLKEARTRQKSYADEHRRSIEKCRAPICWDQVRERVIKGLDMIEVTNEKVVIAKEKLKEARTRQKSYA